MLYRIIVKTTGSKQPSGTYWEKKVLYCGYDREAARQAYHGSEPNDYDYSYGNRARYTTLETIDDAQTSDFADDEVEVVEGEE